MEKKTERRKAGCKTTDGGRFLWHSAVLVPKNCIAATKREVEFSNWFAEFVAAEERATRPVDYSKPGKVTGPFIIPNVIDDDLNLILPPLSSSSSINKEEEKEYDDINKENYCDDKMNDDELNNKMNDDDEYLKKKMTDALIKRKKLAQEEEHLLNELKRVRVRSAEIDNEYRDYQQKISILN